MATIKVIFRGSSQDSCEGTLFYRIIHKRRMRQVHTGHRVMRTEWNQENETVVLTECDARSDYLKTVQIKFKEGLSRFSRIIVRLEKSGNDYTVDNVVEQFLAPETIVGFLSFARKLIADDKKMGKVRVSDHYTAALNRFVGFHGEEEVSFDEFNTTLMGQYECRLKEERLCPNSISYYMRNLRAIYNQAVEQELTEQRNPFRHVYTGIAKTVKLAVSIDVVKSLRSMDLRHDPITLLARDLFLFSFYTRGMAIIDVAFLRKSNLKNGVLSYRRQKTGQLLTIKWEPQMQEILNRHTRWEPDFMFPIIDDNKPEYYKQYRAAYNKILRKLKKIGVSLGLTEALTFHRSRHSWASIAKENNVPLSVICEGMGHDSEKTTRIYLASLDNSVVDNANSKIISLIDR